MPRSKTVFDQGSCRSNVITLEQRVHAPLAPPPSSNILQTIGSAATIEQYRLRFQDRATPAGEVAHKALPTC